MNEVKKQYINMQVSKYIKGKDSEILRDCYIDLLSEFKPKLEYWARTTYMANMHEMMTIFDDAIVNVLKEIEASEGDFVKLFHLRLNSRYKDLLRKLVKQRSYEQFEDEAATLSFEIADEFNLESHVTTKKKADQRQLIDSLLNGADATTTAIVEAFLVHPKPTATAIAKELGFHHSKVTRALNRLAGKFSTKQFGDFRDYLVVQ